MALSLIVHEKRSSQFYCKTYEKNLAQGLMKSLFFGMEVTKTSNEIILIKSIYMILLNESGWQIVNRLAHHFQ
jgi:hypothetical protein